MLSVVWIVNRTRVWYEAGGTNPPDGTRS